MIMRKFDLDQPDIELSDSDAPGSVVVQWNYEGEERTTILHAKQTLEFGRESTCDICLRVEPVEVETNKEATLKISRRHFRLSVENNRVQITDLGSAYGTSVDATTLEPNKPSVIQGGEITVADALRLSVRIEKSDGKINAVRLRRVNNLPGTEYVCLIGEGIIDIGEEALLRLPLLSSRQNRSRALDIGQDQVAGHSAVIHTVDGGISIKRTGNDPVMVNQTELTLNQTVPFPTDGTVQVGNSTFNITIL
jgi:pSer/pThr/pTyr-binding forkhead associated (FHA) protein